MENTRISHYDVGRRLGRGGMGEVYAAVDVDLGRSVALKFVAPELAAEPEALKRFEREARAAAALNHPHIATLFAFEREGERTFIAMELVSGESLRERIQRGPLPVADAFGIARDVASALALAHRRGIAHRDVKPENLMFDEDGVVKLMDFGLARATQASRMTMTGSTLGTAAYMAPESVRGGAGPPGDVFALGIVLHEMLTGELPFTGDSPLALLYTIANEEPKPLRAARPEAPEAVESLVRRMLDKNPETRLDAASVARELATLTGRPLPAGSGDTIELEVSRVPAPESAPTEAIVPSPRRELAERAPARRRWGPVSIAILLGGAIFLATMLVVFGLRRTRGSAHERAVALNNRAFELMQKDSLTAARPALEASLRADPSYAEAMLNLALVLQRSGDPTRAASLYGRVIRDQPHDPALASKAHYGLAEIDMGSGATASAIDHYRSACAMDSTNAAYPNNLAFALIRAGRTDEAETELRAALRRFPGVAALYKNAGLVHFQRGEYVMAINLINQALDLDRSMSGAWALRARANARLGRLADARADQDRLAALHASSAELAEVAADVDEAARRKR